VIETPPSRPLHLKAYVIAQCQESLVRRRLGGASQFLRDRAPKESRARSLTWSFNVVLDATSWLNLIKIAFLVRLI
jgi:hypothetical protein